jgi:hypothetical protein
MSLTAFLPIMAVFLPAALTAAPTCKAGSTLPLRSLRRFDSMAHCEMLVEVTGIDKGATAHFGHSDVFQDDLTPKQKAK